MKPTRALAWSAIVVSIGAAELRAGPSMADSLVQRVRDRYDGKDIFSEVALTLVDENGARRERSLLYFQKDFADDEKMLLYFTGPGDVKGVGLNSISYPEASGKTDDQWIYLPAFKQVKRVPGNDKRGSFMGSEFSYYDMEKIKAQDFSQKVLGEEKVGGEDCVKLERTSTSSGTIRKSGYSRTIVWIQREKGIVMKQLFYNEAGFDFKEMKVLSVQNIQNVWTVTEAEMFNKESGRKSRILFRNVRYDCGVAAKVFQNEIIKEGVGDALIPKVH